jgi:PST family polysaccharide transporter
MKGIKRIIKQYPRLVENFFSLSALNAISFLVPLITVPYLTRILGPEKFGLVSFGLVVMQYFIILTSFGFAFSATQQISIHRDNRQKVSDIFSAVISFKLLLTLLSGLILLVLILTVEQFSKDYLVFVFSFGIVIGDALLPVWLFQGMEKMRFITLVNFVSKVLFTLLIFVFVRSEGDYLIVPLFNTAGYLCAGLISFVIAYRTFKLKISLPKAHIIAEQVKESWSIFVSTLSINLYRNANTLLLGLLTGNYTLVGFYSSAEKIIKGLQSLVSPVSDALFPHLSRRLDNKAETSGLQLMSRLGKYYFLGLLAMSLVLVIFAKPIVLLVLGEKFAASIMDTRIMSFVILFGGMNYFLGILGLVNMGRKKQFMLFVLITGIVSLSSLFVFIPLFDDEGASMVMLLSEFLLFMMLLFYMLKLRRHPDV